MTHIAGCGRFWLWTVAAALVAFSLIAAASIGLFVLPLAVVVTVLAARRTRNTTESLGALVGVGGICGLIPLLQRGPGSLDATPWLLAGTLLAVAGVAAFAVFGRRLAPRA